MRLEITPCETDSPKLKVWELPLRAAVMTAGCAELITAAAVAVNVAVVAPEDTATEDGTITAGVLLVIATDVVSPERVPESVRLHVAVPLGLRDAGLQVRDVTPGAVMTVSDADCAELLVEAVMVAT